MAAGAGAPCSPSRLSVTIAAWLLQRSYAVIGFDRGGIRTCGAPTRPCIRSPARIMNWGAGSFALRVDSLRACPEP
jgi:hypothetical protein